MVEIGDWITVIEGYWKGSQGEVFVANDRFVWVRLIDGEETICLTEQYKIQPTLGQMSLLHNSNKPQEEKEGVDILDKKVREVNGI